MFAKNIHIVCSSFYIAKRKNAFYPENILSAKWFAFYCMHFNSFKINATFYKFPTLIILTNWYKKIPDGFIHCVKAPKLTKYVKKLVYCKPKIGEFFSFCRHGMNDKLGSILFQFPPSFLYSAIKLALIIEAIRLHGILKMFYSKYSRIDLIKLHDLTDKNLFAKVFIFVNTTASKAGVLNAQELKTLFKS